MRRVAVAEVSLHDAGGVIWCERANARESVISIAAHAEGIERLGAALRRLPPRTAYVVACRYGVFGCEQRTIRELSEELIISPQRVSQLQATGISVLRSLLPSEDNSHEL
jgi:DNA-directed RNA polymerase sigma subunit (sigma70/sigma32)